MDTTGSKGFVLYSEVSYAQGVIVDHACCVYDRSIDF